MDRLTTDKPCGNTEAALNLFYIKDMETWVRGGGAAPDFPDVRLIDYMRDIVKKHDLNITLYEDDFNLAEGLNEALFDGTDTIEGIVATLNAAAWAFALFRKKLMAYEDTGLTPEEVQHWKKCIATPTIKHLVEMCEKIEAERDRYKAAEAEGRLIVLPCKVGDVLDLRKRDDIEADFGIVYHFDIWRDETIDVWFEIDSDTVSHVDVGDIGKTVCLTREEAEAALGRADNG